MSIGKKPQHNSVVKTYDQLNCQKRAIGGVKTAIAMGLLPARSVEYIDIPKLEDAHNEDVVSSLQRDIAEKGNQDNPTAFIRDVKFACRFAILPSSKELRERHKQELDDVLDLK